MNKSLKEIAQNINANPKTLRVLMSSKPDLFNQFTYIDNGEIIFESNAEKELINLYNNKDKIFVTFESIADIMDVPVETVVNVLTVNKDDMFKGAIKKSPHGRMETNLFKCKMLNELLEQIAGESPIKLKSNIDTESKSVSDTNDENNDIENNNDDNNTVVENTVSDEPIEKIEETTVVENKVKNTETKKKPSRKKKAKYAMTSETMTKICSDIKNIKNIRLFLLSLPDYKPDDIALMSDEEVRELFDKNYIAIELTTGVWIINKTILPTLADTEDMYFIENT